MNKQKSWLLLAVMFAIGTIMGVTLVSPRNIENPIELIMEDFVNLTCGSVNDTETGIASIGFRLVSEEDSPYLLVQCDKKRVFFSRFDGIPEVGDTLLVEGET